MRPLCILLRESRLRYGCLPSKILSDLPEHLAFPEYFYQNNRLLIHGLADDNVHANQTMELIDALVQEGKQFQMQLYPNRNHSILGLSNRKHLYTRMSDFFIQTLNADK
jgi:hypothetical protein